MNVKKLFDLIFEPVEEEEDTQEEVIVDRPLVRHEFKREEPIKKVELTEAEQKRAEVKKKDVLDRAFIDAKQSTKRTSDSYTRKTADIKPITKYESRPAMSPIFGVLEPEEKSSDSPNYVPSHRSYTKKSSLGTVLSPIYGVIGQKEDVPEEKEIIEKTNKESIVFAQSNMKPLEDNFDDIRTIEPPKEVRAEMSTKVEEKPVPPLTEGTPIASILDSPLDEDPAEETYISMEDITLFDEIER